MDELERTTRAIVGLELTRLFGEGRGIKGNEPSGSAVQGVATTPTTQAASSTMRPKAATETQTPGPRRSDSDGADSHMGELVKCVCGGVHVAKRLHGMMIVECPQAPPDHAFTFSGWIIDRVAFKIPHPSVMW